MTTHASSGFAVETTQLSKIYEEEFALDRVELRVPEGSVYVLVGANGAGVEKPFTWRLATCSAQPRSP